MGSIPHKLILFLLIYLLTFSPIPEVVGSIPTLHIYFLIYFSLNSLIHSRCCGFNSHSSHFIFSFIFMLTLSSIQEVVGLIPTLLIFFLLYFSFNSLIYSRGCGFNPHSPCFIFLLYFSPNSLIHSRGCGFNPHSQHLFFLSFFS